MAETSDPKALLAAIVDSSDDAIISKDLRGVVLSWNAAAERLFGYTAEEMIGQPILRLIPRARYSEESHILSQIAGGRKVDHYETQRVRKDGELIDLAITVSPLRDLSGRIIGASKIARDISLRKAAERERAERERIQRAAREALNRVERRWQVMADQAPVLIWMSGIDGRRTWFNKPWLDFVGRPMEKELGVGWTENLHPEEADGCRRAVQDALDRREQFQVEYRLKRHDGEYRWLIDHGIPQLSHSGELEGFIGSCVDVTERIASEMRLRTARDEAEAASLAKDRFLAMLSHELRTPLAPVLAAMSLLTERTDLPADAREDLRLVKRNVELEARLIDDLLDLTRVSKGKLQLNLEIVDVHDALRHVHDICVGDIQAKGQQVVWELGAARATVLGDAARLRQMFWNLLKNAAKFTPNAGRIVIRTSNSCGDGVAGKICISISDTGIGIAPDRMGVLFTAFEQGDRSVTRQYGGLGLGLAITRALAETHGGAVRAHSEGEGRGATFELDLPVVEGTPSAKASDGESAPVHRTRPLRILLVEDHADTARIMARLLSSLGHEVRTAGTVSEALRAADPNAIDLIISDLGLPDGGGGDLIRQLRGRVNAPAIALSGFGTEEDVARCLDAGFVAHMTKPVNFNRLERLIAQLAR